MAPGGEHPGNGSEKGSKQRSRTIRQRTSVMGTPSRMRDGPEEGDWPLAVTMGNSELAFIVKNNSVGILNKSAGCLSVYVKECV